MEQADHAGGLASSYTDDKGFVWDVGGHVHFSHYAAYDQAVDDVLGKNSFYELRRNSQVWMGDRFVPYPFQSHIGSLNFSRAFTCAVGLVISRMKASGRSPKNLAEWARSTFGRGITEHFFAPYNEKVWAHPLHMLGTGWMGERVAPVDVWKVLKGLLGGGNAGAWGPNNSFRFPKVGGTGAIWSAMAQAVGSKHIRLDSEVIGVDLRGKTVTLKSGEKLSYDHLISSLPLDVFCAMAQPLSAEALARSKQLLFSTSYFVGVGLRGRPPAFIEKMSWMYFPQPDIPYYRATVMSNYSPACVPDPAGTWSLLLEMSESPFSKKRASNRLDETIAALLRTGFVRNPDDVLSTWTFSASHGYPVPQVGRDDILSTVQAELEHADVFSRGRFGGWKYEVSNQDHSFMQGVEVVDRLVTGKPEVTYPFPHLANRPRT